LTELEKNIKELEAMFKAGILSAEDYKNQIAQVNDSAGVEEKPKAAPSSTTKKKTANTNIESPAEPPPPVIPDYYVFIDGKKSGPFKRNVFIKKIQAGEYDKDTMVWMTGMTDWVEAGSLSDLERYFPDLPPPPPLDRKAEERRRAEEEAKRKADEEAAAKRRADEEAATRRRADEEAATRRRADEEAAARRRADEEAAARRRADEEAAVRRRADEEAEARRRAQQQQAQQQSAPPADNGVKAQVSVYYNRALANWKEFQKKRGAGYYGGNSIWFKKFDKALLDSIISDLTAAIQISANFYDVLELRALAWEQKLDYAKACEDWERVVKLVPRGECTVPNATGFRSMYSMRLEEAKKKRDRKGKISGFLIDRVWNLDEDGKCFPDNT